MKTSTALDERLIHIARRIAVAVVLDVVAPSDPQVAALSPHLRAILADDLCGLSYAADAARVSEAALACAIVEAEPGTSLAASVAYATRALFEASGFGATALAAADRHRSARACSSLTTALDVLNEAGVGVAVAPRSLMRNLKSDALAIADVRLRILAALYSEGEGRLVAALTAEPYCIDRANVLCAISGVSGSPRDVLASAIPQLAGGQAKDSAIAALRAMDAILADARPGLPLADAMTRAQSAIAEFSGSLGSDADEDLLRQACAADKIWSAGKKAVSVSTRIEAFVDATTMALLDGVQFVPYLATTEAAASLAFLDAPCRTVSTRRFATALGVDPDSFMRATMPDLQIFVTASQAVACADYLREHTAAENLRAWPLADTPAPVRAPQMTFSASRLNSYVKCPRRFFYEYLCEAVEDPGSLHATYGRVMHDALERLHREVRFPSRHEPGLILERLLRALDAAFGAARADFASQLEYETSRWRARRMAEQYVRWLVAETKRMPVEICGVEIFERGRFGEHDFVGYIDRIDKPVGGGPVTIYDYKTGRIEPDARAYLERVRCGDEAQLAIYYAMRTAAGDQIGRIALVSIRDPRDDVWILALDVVPEDVAVTPAQAIDGVLQVTCTRADLDASLGALVRRCNMLTREGVEHFRPGDDPPCSFCAYARACRERPLEGERVFAR